MDVDGERNSTFHEEEIPVTCVQIFLQEFVPGRVFGDIRPRSLISEDSSTVVLFGNKASTWY